MEVATKTSLPNGVAKASPQKESTKGQAEGSIQTNYICEHLRRKVVKKLQQGSLMHSSLLKDILRNNLNAKHKRKDQQSQT